MEANESPKCECCGSKPSPIEARSALVRQLSLFVELEAMLSDPSGFNIIDDQENGIDEDDQDQEMEEEEDAFEIIEVKKNQSIDRNNNKHEEDIASLVYMDSQVEKVASEGSMNISREGVLSEADDPDLEEAEFGLRMSLVKTEKLKPLLPSYLYENNEPLIGREWLLKEIEKVKINLF